MDIFNLEEKEYMRLLAKLAKKNEDVNSTALKDIRANFIERGVRKRYKTPGAEFSAIRKRNVEPEKFEEYNSYVEQVILEVDSIISTI